MLRNSALIEESAIRRLNRENGRCNFEQTTRNGTADKSRAQE